MPTKLESSHKPGTLFLREIKFDYIFKRKVMRSGKVGKIYLPKDLIGKHVYVVLNLNGGVNNESAEKG